MTVQTLPSLSNVLGGFLQRRVAAAPKRFRMFIADSVRPGRGENAGMMLREQARTLLANARLFSVIGLVTTGLMATDLPAAGTGTGLALCDALVTLYVVWLALAQARRRVPDIVFIRASTAILFLLGVAWGALALLATAIALAAHTDLVTPTTIMMALISTPMITAPFLAALAFWVPMTSASAIAVYGLIGPVDGFTYTLFAGYALFTLAGICLNNFTLHERAVGRISLARGRDTIDVLLGSGTLGDPRHGTGGWSWQTEADGSLVDASSQFFAVLGQDRAAIGGRTLTGLIGRAAEPDGRNHDVAHALGSRVAFRELAVTAHVSGETRWWSLSGHPVDEGGTFAGFRGIGTDITDRRRAEARMQALATRDSLTGVANRQALLDQLDTACAAARTGAPGSGFALVLIDLDRFKDVNDRFGHATGDELLRSVAARMRQTVRGEDRVARLGGDEFAVMLARAGEGEAAEIVGRLSAAFADCVRLDTRTASVGATFGVAICPKHGTEPAQLLRNADLALYDGKRRERGSLAVFRRELEAAAETRATMQEGLRAAIDSDAVRLLFRPTVWTGTDATVSAEPVASWSTPGGAILSSLSLFRLASEGQLLAPFTHAFLRRSLEVAGGWNDVRLTFGLPAPLLAAPALIEALASNLRRGALPLGRVELAVRAADLAGAPEGAAEQVGALQRDGVRLVLDEFGTGALDLSLFRRFRFDAIRLHGRLLRELPGNSSASFMLRWILVLASELEMELIADGLANPEQLARLRDLGVAFARGRAVHNIAASRRDPARREECNLRPLSGGRRDEMLVAAEALIGGGA